MGDYDAAAERIEQDVPDDATTPEEVEEALEGEGYTQKQIDAFKDSISDIKRDVDSNRVRNAERVATQGTGKGGVEDRATMVTDAKGRFLGRLSDVTTWEDQHGNLMGKREGAPMTDAKKVEDSSSR